MTKSRMLRSRSPARVALRRGARLAEQPLEHRARIDLHRQRRRRRAPGDRVGVGAAVSGRARADVAGEVLRRQFERREGRVLTDLRGHDLIDRDAGENVLGLRALRSHTGEPPCRADRVIATRRGRPDQVRDHHDRVAEWFERLQRRRELESRSDAGRRPRFHDRAVGNEHRPEACARLRRRLRERGDRRHHRVEQRQRDRGADSAQERSPRQMRSWSRYSTHVTIKEIPCNASRWAVIGIGPEFLLFTFIRNGSLLTMASTTAENRYLFAAAMIAQPSEPWACPDTSIHARAHRSSFFRPSS